MWATSTASEFNWRKTGPSEANQDQERWGTKALFFSRHSLLITQDSLTWLGGWCSWLLEMSSAPNENATMWIISSGKHWWLWQLTHQRLGDMVPSLTGLSSYLSKLWDHLESPFLTEQRCLLAPPVHWWGLWILEWVEENYAIAASAILQLLDRIW